MQMLLNLFYNQGMKEDLLSCPQVGKLLGVTSAAVNRWCAAGHFPNAFRLNPQLPKSAWRIPAGDVEIFKQKRREQYGFIRLPVAPKESDKVAV